MTWLSSLPVSSSTTALLTQAIKIRTKGVLSEVVLPQARRDEIDVAGGMGVNPLQHLYEVDVGIDSLQTLRGEETLHDADGAYAVTIGYSLLLTGMALQETMTEGGRHASADQWQGAALPGQAAGQEVLPESGKL